jgi:prophage tail gpP-like protein
MPRREETATLYVNGMMFDDWESVMVQDRMHEPYPQFRFTAAERDRPVAEWQLLQFAPGDNCMIFLAGIRAITGIILSRQVAYDANQHGVQLQGVGRSWAAATGCIIDETHNYDGMPFQAIADKVTAPFGVKVIPKGSVDNTPFKRCQSQPGQTVWDFLEGIARPRGIIMGSDTDGNLLAIGQHEQPAAQELTEGYDIKRCQCVISIENTRYDFRVQGETAADNSQHGKASSEQEAIVGGTLRLFRPLVTVAEQPVWGIGELQSRAANERKWNEGTRIDCTITVWGWLRKNGALWRAGDEVTVQSPMLMLGPSTVLKAETVTFTQSSDSGTETTLQLRDPYYLNGKYNYQLGKPVGQANKMQRPEDQIIADMMQEEREEASDQAPAARSAGPAANAPAAQVPDPGPATLDEL